MSNKIYIKVISYLICLLGICILTGLIFEIITTYVLASSHISFECPLYLINPSYWLMITASMTILKVLLFISYIIIGLIDIKNNKYNKHNAYIIIGFLGLITCYEIIWNIIGQINYNEYINCENFVTTLSSITIINLYTQWVQISLVIFIISVELFHLCKN